jgi:phosphoadenosine phosphosulfate reductase
LLEQLYLATGKGKVAEAIARIKQYEPPEGYILAFSGGKDSVVIKRLAIMAGVKFEPHYCRTGIDPPELVYFIRQYHPDVIFIPPLMTMWEGILKHGLPLRQRRWCCQVLKEHDGNGRSLLQGVRWAESAARRRRWDIYTEYDHRRGSKAKLVDKHFVSPIIDWSDADVWQFIKQESLPYCSLYLEGFKRIGCILCPFSQGEHLQEELDRWPKMVEAYKRAAGRYIERISAKNTLQFKSGEEYFNWWIKERLNSRSKVGGMI